MEVEALPDVVVVYSDAVVAEPEVEADVPDKPLLDSVADVAAVAVVGNASAEPGDDCPPSSLLRGVDSEADTDYHGTPAEDGVAAGNAESRSGAAAAVVGSASVVPGDTLPACSDAAARDPLRSFAAPPPASCARSPGTPRACTAAHCPPCPTSGPAGTRLASSAR